MILLTSNVGTDTIHEALRRPRDDARRLRPGRGPRPDLLKVFKPAFLGRVILVPYFPMADNVLRQIIELQLRRVPKRVQENHRAKFSYTPELVAAIAGRCTEVESGARNVDHILTRTLLPEMAAEFLERMSACKTIGAVKVTMGEKGEFRYEIG